MAVFLSLCLLLCFPVAAGAEDDDLLSHYTGDDEAYCAFLMEYLSIKYKDDLQNDIGGHYLARLVSQEMANMYNAPHSDFVQVKVIDTKDYDLIGRDVACL